MTEPSTDRIQERSKIAELIRDIHVAMLTTVAEDGTLHSRPMATQQMESFEGQLWFLTRADSQKVFEVREDAQVSLTYVETKETFVALSGRASIFRDQQKIDELWKPAHKAWFPEGKEDPEIRVLRVTVEFAEYWHAPSNAVVKNFEILKRAVSGGEGKVGEHGRVEMGKAS